MHCVFKEKKEREGGESLLVEVLTSRKFVQIVLTLVVGESMTQPSQRAINKPGVLSFALQPSYN